MPSAGHHGYPPRYWNRFPGGMPFLYAGIGYGGSCSQRRQGTGPSRTGSWLYREHSGSIEQVNKHQKMFLANRVIQHFGGTLKGERLHSGDSPLSPIPMIFENHLR